MNAGNVNEQNETTMTKVLIVESMDLTFSQSFQVNIPYDSQQRELDLGHSIHHILHNILSYTEQHQIFYFHPGQQLFEYAGLYPFKYPLLVGEDFITLQDITVRIRKIAHEGNHSPHISKEAKELKEKKKRVGPRTIREVLEKVSQWREITHKNPKITLEEGAKIIGVPKKTLDDYYAHLKQGSEFNFDFESNLEQKIGVLRSFVRQKTSKKKSGGSQFQFLQTVLKNEGDDSDDEEEEQQ